MIKNTSFSDRRIKILNFIAYFTAITAFLFLVIHVIKNDINFYIFLDKTIAVIISVLTIYLQRIKKYVLARSLFISLIAFIMFLNTNFVASGNYSEFEYIAIPLLSILFFDKLFYQ